MALQPGLYVLHSLATDSSLIFIRTEPVVIGLPTFSSKIRRPTLCSPFRLPVCQLLCNRRRDGITQVEFAQRTESATSVVNLSNQQEIPSASAWKPLVVIISLFLTLHTCSDSTSWDKVGRETRDKLHQSACGSSREIRDGWQPHCRRHHHHHLSLLLLLLLLLLRFPFSWNICFQKWSNSSNEQVTT